MTNYARLIVLTVMLLIIFVFFHSTMNSTESRLYRKILSAQKFLWDATGSDVEHDPS